MDETRQLRKTWLLVIDGYKFRVNPTPLVHAGDLQNTVNRIVRMAFVEADKPDDGATIERLIEHTRKKYSPMFDNINALAAQYNERYEQWALLLDRRRQEDWATTWDYIKSFIWRTAQAIAFAGVVLGASYVAKMFELPVPGLRFPP